MFSLDVQLITLKKADSDLREVGIPVTGIYMPTDTTDAGIEIDGKYILHIAPYQEPGLYLDRVESPGEEIASFSSINTLIQYIMENT